MASIQLMTPVYLALVTVAGQSGTPLLYSLYWYCEYIELSRVGDWKLIIGHPGLFRTIPVALGPNFPLPPVDGPVLNLSLLTLPPFTPGEPTIDYDCPVDPNTNFLLFNLKQDPNEETDLSASYPYIVKTLMSKLEEERTKRLIPRYRGTRTPASNPNNFLNEDGIPVWSPGWCPDSL